MATPTKPNPIQELLEQGQSLWYDNILRTLITSGELARLRDLGVRGVTSNPTIFGKAVSGSTDYDEGIFRKVQAGLDAESVMWELLIEDIQAAADVFRPVYDSSEGRDGYVSIEVGPEVAHSTKKTVAMARDLRRRTGRPNVMVKIPATPEGLPAIRTMIGEGANINITLIFAVSRYAEVVEAFLGGLEDLKAAGGDLSQVASVASFFVSRVDGKVDKLLQAKIDQAGDPKVKKELSDLFGKAAIDNSKMAYVKFKELHSGPRWEALEKAGARPQRCLWASTSTKDPRYPDTYYVEELIGPDTVDTVPPQTLEAFLDHGEVRRSLDENLDAARRHLQALAAAGIDLDRVTEELETEGVESFAKSFEDLLATVKEEVRAIKRGRGPRQWSRLGALKPAVDETLKELEKETFAERLWRKDPSLWARSAAKKKEIAARLGWLDVHEKMAGRLDELREVAREGRAFTDVVLLGMGGSSLCPDVLRHTFGSAKGHPRLQVLDTTDPATIRAVSKAVDPVKTLFIAASKSGETVETLSHLAYFWEEVTRAGKRKPGRNFAAITDPGSGLERLAREREFRWVFQNPPDIGGRYSALSYFGLVPAALIGVDVKGLLDRAADMATACRPDQTAEKNLGLWLGAAIGRLALEHHDKLTLIISPKVAALSYWIEQLIAESTGKQGKGIVPVEGEPVGRPQSYGSDRLFVHVRMGKEAEDRRVQALEDSGHPVITLTLRDPLDLGAEFLRWEMATAVAGAVLGIDPFDQPNVQESKDNTKRVLAEFEAAGHLPEAPSVPAGGAEAQLRKLLGSLKPGSYFSIMAYTARTATSERSVASMRTAVRDAKGVATTAGYGPRFLHSTGQLHKGGPPVGVFLQVVQQDTTDVAIPGQPFTFSVLKQAQALGDYQSLSSRGLPVLRVDLGPKPGAGWKALAAALAASLG